MHEDRTGARVRVLAQPEDGGEVPRRTRVVAWGLLACALVLVRPGPACAGWPLEAGGRVVLGFGAVYSAGEGDTSQHRGVDIEAEQGDRIATPSSGTVSFVGKVPGVGGERVMAVTIDTSVGKVTLLPLQDASVSRGAQVSEGDGVGTLAGSGDGSSTGAHLHVGVREGDLYVDPLGFMAPPAAPSENQGSGSGAGAAASVGIPADAGAVAVAPTGVGVAAGVSLAPPAGSSVAGKTSRVAKAGRTTKTAASGELAAGVSVADRSPSPAGVVAPATPVTTASGGLSAAAGAAQATVLTGDGVVVAVGSGVAARPAARPAWSSLATRARAFARRSLRLASLFLLGVMAALGALWPLWRVRGQKGTGKVLVRTLGEDVAAAPSR